MDNKQSAKESSLPFNPPQVPTVKTPVRGLRFDFNQGLRVLVLVRPHGPAGIDALVQEHGLIVIQHVRVLHQTSSRRYGSCPSLFLR